MSANRRTRKSRVLWPHIGLQRNTPQKEEVHHVLNIVHVLLLPDTGENIKHNKTEGEHEGHLPECSRDPRTRPGGGRVDTSPESHLPSCI